MKSPEWIHLIGNGILTIGDLTFEAPFSLYRNPYVTKFVVTDVSEDIKWSVRKSLDSKNFEVKLNGTLNDGRQVCVGKLWLRDVIEFIALEGISLGQTREIPPSLSKYPLTGYFDKELQLNHEGWSITTIPCENPEDSRALYRNWRIPVEGMVLELRHENANMEQHREFAQIIMTLLSIAKGTGVSCSRHFFVRDNEEVEIWRNWTGDDIGPGPIVPEFEITNFLKQTLPVWQSLSPQKREALRLAKDYVNLSSRGYMDTRLLQIAQPWEFLAGAWGIEGELSCSDQNLRATLLQAKKKWFDDNLCEDQNGFWGSRISSIFDWPKLIDKIEKISVEFGLDLKRIGFDPALLKNTRDNVAHSGILPASLQTKPDNQAFNLLALGQYCLQLLMLRMLDYRGRVNHSTDGYPTFLNINEALNKART